MVRTMWIALLVVPAALLLLVGYLWLNSPGRPRPFLDADGRPLAGSIAEKVRVPINGVEQGMFIKGKDVTQPVLLYVHGGLPSYFMTERYPTGLEEHFTVVWWDQRGAGLSYDPARTPETLTLEQVIDDTLAVTDYLRQRFDQDKIYLMGHSGGSFIGIQAAAIAPEKYHAYIGVAQMSDQRRSELLAYDYMLEQFRAQGNTRMVQRLEAAPVTDTEGPTPAYLTLRDGAMHTLGIGTTHDMRSVLSGIMWPSLTHPEYTLAEKINLWRGKMASGVSALWQANITTDLAQTTPKLDIPVYFLHGIHDYTCSYPLAQAYFTQLEAPVKGFYSFAHSAHSPIFEEPDKTRQILVEDVLAGTNRLADARD